MVQTVLGQCVPAELGVTLMHEHLVIGWHGWEIDATAPPFDRADAQRRCIERMCELKELGLSSLVDPCPIDLGRDVELMAEVAQAAGVHIVCATGLYKEEQGAPYFRFRSGFADVASEITETLVKEITEGIGSTGIKAGVIKVATGPNQITTCERIVLTAAARAHRETGIPIVTHTDQGTMAPEQLDIFEAEGVNPKHVVVGHSCGTANLAYHVELVDRGAYLGFDRFGLDVLHPDRLRMAALIGLLGIGCHKQIVLSHDSVWCWRGRPFPIPEEALPQWNPRHVFKNILPALREAGVSESKIDAMLIENPRRLFEGDTA